MRRLAPILLLTASIALPAGADSGETVRTFQKTFPGSGLETVSLDVPVGEVEMKATDAGNAGDVQVEIRFVCDRHRRLSVCTDRAKKMKVTTDRDGDRIAVKVHKLSSWGDSGLHVKAYVTAPRGLSVRADLGVGELSVSGFEGDVDADLGVGEAHVSAPESAVRTVSVDTGIGEGHLFAGGRHYSSEGLFTREIHWSDGPGRSRIAIDCGVGEAHVRLERAVQARR